MNIRIAISIGLLVGCLAGLTGVAAGAEKADSTAAEVVRLEHQLASLRREGRMLRRAAALMSEVALFDEGVVRGRSVSAESLRGPGEPIVVQRQFSVGDEATGIGGGERGLPVSGTDMERVEAEIRALEMRLKELKKGAQKP